MVPRENSVAIVMPCLNEAATISSCVNRAHDALRMLADQYQLAGEVIVADNGSTDGSQEIAEEAGARVVNISQRGYGAALIGGFSATNASYLVMGDSDCSYDFVEAVPMIKCLMDGADLCMGNRFRGEIKPGAMPWKNRYIGNPALSGVLRFLFRTKIGDAHCGLRAIKKDALDQLSLSSTGMEFASEMLLKSVLQQFSIAEVPVTLSPDRRGRAPHLNPWRDGLRHLVYMLLLSPTWLFLAPALFLFSVGFAITVMLQLGGDAEMVWIGGYRFGDHWAVVASASMILATQAIVFWMAALMGSFRDGLLVPTERARYWLGFSRLQYWMLAGASLTLVGLFWAGTVTTGWINSNFAALNEIRTLIAAFTMIIIGVQVFFSGFLLSMIAGNRSRHSAVLPEFESQTPSPAIPPLNQPA
ncbi:glycosyltransferase family 2 protein [Roseovarius aestuarii]|uniref:Glucosyl-3-phosphoglycerate synthase n=1 Tax=Roseovarius aestuarii TaxID=475083 RepID=A0A1X7BWJ0_9RHOB|nr:glycosyltransferase family 2 protein [Roseovarius aestuarii]SMC13974.1 Glucosyl-3-phosphoglycerate synthase [Roseovarius aestuarii]